MPTGDLGARLVGVGAILLLADELSARANGRTRNWAATLQAPRARLSAGARIVGSCLVAVGSALLLIASHGLTVVAVTVVLVGTTVAIYVVMTVRLRDHMLELCNDEPEDTRQSWAWCFAHPFWRPRR